MYISWKTLTCICTSHQIYLFILIKYLFFMLCFNSITFLFIIAACFYTCSTFIFEYKRHGNSFTTIIDIDSKSPINYDAAINIAECVSTAPMNESFIYDTKRIVKDDNQVVTTTHIQSKLYKSIVTFRTSTPKISMQNMLLYVYTVPYDKHKSSSAKAVLGLGYKFNDMEYSLIHHLYELKLIRKKAFSFMPLNNKNRSSFGFFGEISKEVLTNYTYKYTLPVDDRDTTWGIRLNHVKLSTASNNNIGEFINTDHYAYLNTYEDRIFVPIDFFRYINETLFPNLYRNGICEVNKGSNWYINCNHTAIMSMDFPDITFNFGKAEIKLTKQETFRELSKTKNFFIIQSSGKINDKYLFGSFLFDKYITEFDYDSNAVILYSKIPLLSSNNNNIDNIITNIGGDNKYLIKKVCALLLVFLLIIMITYLLIQKYTNITNIQNIKQSQTYSNIIT